MFLKVSSGRKSVHALYNKTHSAFQTKVTIVLKKYSEYLYTNTWILTVGYELLYVPEKYKPRRVCRPKFTRSQSAYFLLNRTQVSPSLT